MDQANIDQMFMWAKVQNSDLWAHNDKEKNSNDKNIFCKIWEMRLSNKRKGLTWKISVMGLVVATLRDVWICTTWPGERENGGLYGLTGSRKPCKEEYCVPDSSQGCLSRVALEKETFLSDGRTQQF